MGKINLETGEIFIFSKTFGECDVSLFAGLVGDFFPNHVNEQYCKTTPFKTRIVHGCLTFGLASTVSGMAALKTEQTCLSLGYDKLRFLLPVFFADTITAIYRVTEVDAQRMRAYAECTMENQKGETVLTCKHILKIVE